MICKNCKHRFEGNFCDNCGQNSKVQRINFSYLVNEIPNSIFQINRGFLFTLKELVIRPGASIREFLSGKRKRHYKPVAFLLITSTLYVLITYLTDRNTIMEDLVFGFRNGAKGEAQASEQAVLDWISKYQAYVTLLILPLYSLASYSAFSKSKYNYFEHLVINIYIMAFQIVIYLILGFIFFKENILLITPIVIGMAYNMWTYNQLFDDKKLRTNLARVVLTYVIFIILVVVIIFIAGALGNILN